MLLQCEPPLQLKFLYRCHCLILIDASDKITLTSHSSWTLGVFYCSSLFWSTKSLLGLAPPPPPYLAELCRPVVHLTGRRHLRSVASGKLDVQRTATAIGRRNFAVSGPETWNSLPAELRLSTLFRATFARRLKARLFVSTE